MGLLIHVSKKIRIWSWKNKVFVNAGLQDITDAIFSVHRTRFVYGSIVDTIYPAAGSSADWVYDELNVACSFAPELRDQGTKLLKNFHKIFDFCLNWYLSIIFPVFYLLLGRYGFILPENQIQPVKEEMWAGFTTMADYVIRGQCDSK